MKSLISREFNFDSVKERLNYTSIYDSGEKDMFDVRLTLDGRNSISFRMNTYSGERLRDRLVQMFPLEKDDDDRLK